MHHFQLWITHGHSRLVLDQSPRVHKLPEFTRLALAIEMCEGRVFVIFSRYLCDASVHFTVYVMDK